MINKEQLDRLNKQEDFRLWLDAIYDIREGILGNMSDATTDQLHQRTGAIAAYQSLLDMAGYDRRQRPI